MLFYYYKNESTCEIRYAHVKGLGYQPGVAATEYGRVFMENHRHATLYCPDGTELKGYRFGKAGASDGSWYVSLKVPCSDANAFFSNPGMADRLRLAND